MPRATQVRIAEQAKALMEEDLSRPQTIASLAKALCVSETTLKEAFRATFGCPVYTWYRRLRIESAAKMLLEEGCSVGVAASRVGYANPSKFSAAFASVMGSSPRVWVAARRDLR